MIGIINHKLVFEFRDIDGLVNAISYYMSEYNTIIITNRSDLIKAIISNGKLVFNKLREEDLYVLHGTNNKSYVNLEANTELPMSNDIYSDNIRFEYRVQLIPRPID